MPRSFSQEVLNGFDIYRHRVEGINWIICRGCLRTPLFRSPKDSYTMAAPASKSRIREPRGTEAPTASCTSA
eukprot:5157480-Amphidinium_carterae.1